MNLERLWLVTRAEHAVVCHQQAPKTLRTEILFTGSTRLHTWLGVHCVRVNTHTSSKTGTSATKTRPISSPTAQLPLLRFIPPATFFFFLTSEECRPSVNPITYLTAPCCQLRRPVTPSSKCPSNRIPNVPRREQAACSKPIHFWRSF